MRPSDKEAYRTLLVEWNDRVAWIWARYYVAAAARIRERLLDVAEVKPGDSVLDVGTATGSAAIAAAQRVGETGRVVGIDTSPKMVKKARESAAEWGLITLEFHLMDSASLEASLTWGLVDEYLAMPPRVRERFRQEAIKAMRPFETREVNVAFFVARRATS